MNPWSRMRAKGRARPRSVLWVIRQTTEDRRIEFSSARLERTDVGQDMATLEGQPIHRLDSTNARMVTHIYMIDAGNPLAGLHTSQCHRSAVRLEFSSAFGGHGRRVKFLLAFLRIVLNDVKLEVLLLTVRDNNSCTEQFQGILNRESRFHWYWVRLPPSQSSRCIVDSIP